MCIVIPGKKRAYPRIRIQMGDKDALTPLEPCFNTKVMGPDKKGMYVLERFGHQALALAEALSQ